MKLTKEYIDTVLYKANEGCQDVIDKLLKLKPHLKESGITDVSIIVKFDKVKNLISKARVLLVI